MSDHFLRASRRRDDYGDENGCDGCARRGRARDGGSRTRRTRAPRTDFVHEEMCWVRPIDRARSLGESGGWSRRSRRSRRWPGRGPGRGEGRRSFGDEALQDDDREDVEQVTDFYSFCVVSENRVGKCEWSFASASSSSPVTFSVAPKAREETELLTEMGRRRGGGGGFGGASSIARASPARRSRSRRGYSRSFAPLPIASSSTDAFLPPLALED